MQSDSLKLKARRQDGIPILDHFIERMGVGQILSNHIGHKRYVHALLLLIKNILLDHQPLYAIGEWSKSYDPALVYGGRFGDDVIARALDKVYSSDRATIQTEVVLQVIKEFEISMDRLHNDSTSISFHGSYEDQAQRAIKLKRGHSKDHRPDLKQLLYSLTITSDGAVPVHFKSYDGNVTDDTTHWETWMTLRSLMQKPDFLYVADSKLCTTETMRKIDRDHGKFVTVLPRTRREVGHFYDDVYSSVARWEYLYKRQSSRKKKEFDVFEVAQGFYQSQEGFRLYWYRSSKKRERDRGDREQRIDVAMERLSQLSDQKRRGPKTKKSFEKLADRIVTKYKVKEWVTVTVEVDEVESFKKQSAGRPKADALYRRNVQKRPRLIIKKNQQGIDRSVALDGIFPLLTNSGLGPLETLKSYKYQPFVEKRHSLLKSSLQAAPVWLKKNDRIEPLFFVYFLSQLLASLIERELRTEMKRNGVKHVCSLPEQRKSKTPTLDQIMRLFENRTFHTLFDGKTSIKTFTEPLTAVQKQILALLGVPVKNYTL